MNGMSVTIRSVDQGRNQKEVQVSKGENVNPVISVDDSEGRFVLHFFDPATLEDPSKACVVWCLRQYRNSHFVMGAIYLREDGTGELFLVKSTASWSSVREMPLLAADRVRRCQTTHAQKPYY